MIIGLDLRANTKRGKIKPNLGACNLHQEEYWIEKNFGADLMSTPKLLMDLYCNDQ